MLHLRNRVFINNPYVRKFQIPFKLMFQYIQEIQTLEFKISLSKSTKHISVHFLT